MVSTDDIEIAEVAKFYGAEVPFLRSQLTSDDYSTTVDVLLEVIYQYETLNMFSIMPVVYILQHHLLLVIIYGQL